MREELHFVYMQMFQERMQSTTSSPASSSRSSDVPRPSSHRKNIFPNRPGNSNRKQAKPYDRHIASGGSLHKRDSICILCGRPDHHAIDCRERNSVSGGLVVSEWANQQFRAKYDKGPVCFNFNIGRSESSPTVRQHSHQGSHRCSLCLGSHSAISCNWRD